MKYVILDTGLLLGFCRKAPFALKAREEYQLGDPGITSPLLLQAVGRPHPKGGRQCAGRTPVAGIPGYGVRPRAGGPVAGCGHPKPLTTRPLSRILQVQAVPQGRVTHP